METIKVYPSTPNPIVPATPGGNYDTFEWEEKIPQEEFPNKYEINLPMQTRLVQPPKVVSFSHQMILPLIRS